MEGVDDDQVDELKGEIKGLKEELERLKQEKQSDTGSSRSVNAIEDEMEEVADQLQDVAGDAGWSRRDFLKAVGGGAAGLGAAAMLPSLGSAFKVESDNALEYFNQSGVGGASFSVTPGGNVTAPQLGEPNDKIQNIHASSVTTDQVNDIHYINTSDDPQTIHDNASAGDLLIFRNGTHTGSLSSTSDGHVLEISKSITVVIPIGATFKLAANELSTGDSGRLISIANGTSDVTIVGDGTLDGNKANNSISSMSDFALIKFKDNVSNVRIGNGLSLVNSPGQAIRPDASAGNEITGLRITDFDITDCEEGIVWTFANDVIISEFDIENIGSQDALEPVHSEDWVIGHGVIDTVETAAIDIFTNARDGKIAHLTIRNAAQAGDHGILASTTGTQPFDVDIVDVTLISTGTSANNSSARGVKVDSGSTNITFEHCEVRDSQHAGWEIAGDRCDVIDSKAISNGHYGINYTGDDAKLKGNTCRDNDRDGIRSGGVSNNIQNNICKNNNQSGLKNFGGMLIDANADRNIVTGNQVFDDQGTATQEKGIRLDSPTNSLVAMNVTYGNSEDDILDNAASSTTVTGNKVGTDYEEDLDPASTYSLSNVTTDRTLDADSTSDAELADVLSTLIQDLGLDA